jgi:hypothetical protein
MRLRLQTSGPLADKTDATESFLIALRGGKKKPRRLERGSAWNRPPEGMALDYHLGRVVQGVPSVSAQA